VQSVRAYLLDLRLGLTVFGSLLKAARGNAASGLIVNVNGSFFQSGHQDGFHGAVLSLGFGMAV
jgi:hypothetical protein